MSTSAKGRREVEEFIADSAHPRRDEIELVRQAILSARPDIGEQIKWNTPSFTYVGDDLVTFRLQPGDRIELILHRGAKKKADAEDFSFDDPTGLVEWVTNESRNPCTCRPRRHRCQASTNHPAGGCVDRGNSR